jgi:hypothetical protein
MTIVHLTDTTTTMAVTIETAIGIFTRAIANLGLLKTNPTGEAITTRSKHHSRIVNYRQFP